MQVATMAAEPTTRTMAGATPVPATSPVSRWPPHACMHTLSGLHSCQPCMTAVSAEAPTLQHPCTADSSDL